MSKIFVFGSNLAGRHGSGAALYARQYCRAILGEGVGRSGDAYGIPTKGLRLEVLPLDVIETHIKDFIQYATDHPELTFTLTRVGCGLAGYKNHQIAPLFKGVPLNVEIPEEWVEYIKVDKA